MHKTKIYDKNRFISRLRRFLDFTDNVRNFTFVADPSLKTTVFSAKLIEEQGPPHVLTGNQSPAGKFNLTTRA